MQDQALIFVICYSLAIILIYYYIKFKNKTKNMQLIEAKCSDTTLRTTYQKNIRMYYYSYKYQNEEYTTSDKTRFLIPFFNPKINKVFKIYIDPKKPINCVTPLEIFYSKIYFWAIIFLLLVPLAFFM